MCSIRWFVLLTKSLRLVWDVGGLRSPSLGLWSVPTRDGFTTEWVPVPVKSPVRVHLLVLDHHPTATSPKNVETLGPVFQDCNLGGDGTTRRSLFGNGHPGSQRKGNVIPESDLS